MIKGIVVEIGNIDERTGSDSFPGIVIEQENKSRVDVLNLPKEIVRSKAPLFLKPVTLALLPQELVDELRACATEGCPLVRTTRLVSGLLKAIEHGA